MNLDLIYFRNKCLIIAFFVFYNKGILALVNK